MHAHRHLQQDVRSMNNCHYTVRACAGRLRRSPCVETRNIRASPRQPFFLTPTQTHVFLPLNLAGHNRGRLGEGRPAIRLRGHAKRSIAGLNPRARAATTTKWAAEVLNTYRMLVATEPKFPVASGQERLGNERSQHVVLVNRLMCSRNIRGRRSNGCSLLGYISSCCGD